MAGGLHGRVMRVLSRRAGIRLFRFFHRELDPAPAIAVPPRGVALRLLQEGEAATLCADPDLDLRQEAVRGAYTRGDLCVGAFEDHRLIGYCWLAFAPLHHLDGVRVAFASEVAWIYKSFVRPSHRGRGVAAALYLFGDAACRERGRSTSLICVESHNGASVAAAVRAGYLPSGYAAYLRRPSRLRVWRSPAAARRQVVFALPTDAA
jgi:GNAT superfamily N-acetyltransferase